MEVRLYALLVIYNRSCEDSPSCEGLRRDLSARAVIVDNSTEPNDNARYCARRGFGYVSMGGNRGLAAAYNRGIAWIKRHTNATHVVLLDDDTTLPEGFLEGTATFAAAHEDTQVILPLVDDEKGLLSPCRIEGWLTSRVTDVHELTPDTLTAINSGMTVALTVFDDYEYDEGYFLDYIDHAFVRDLRARGVTFGITKQRLTQRFAGNARGDRRAAKRRLAIFKQDFRRFCGRTLKGRLTAEAVIMRRRFKVWLLR